MFFMFLLVLSKIFSSSRYFSQSLPSFLFPSFSLFHFLLLSFSIYQNLIAFTSSCRLHHQQFSLSSCPYVFTFITHILYHAWRPPTQLISISRFRFHLICLSSGKTTNYFVSDSSICRCKTEWCNGYHRIRMPLRVPILENRKSCHKQEGSGERRREGLGIESRKDDQR